MIKTKKQMFIIIGVFALVLLLGSVSYAWFSYRGETGSSEIVAGDIYMRMTEGNETLTLTNIFPETKEEARARNDNYITFELSGLNTSNKTIYYEILLNHGDDKPSPKSRYADSDLRFDLVELDNNGDEVTYVVDAGGYDSLIDKRIWVDTIDANTQTEVSKKYKLRAWLSDDVIISDSEPNANYNTTEYPNKYATIKVKVNGDFQEKEAQKQAYQLIRSLASTKNYIASYDDIIAQNPTFTTQDQVSSSATKQTVYYYTGDDAAANANVLFAGYCWQIVRTTDNGGVRMIYNGVAQKNVILTTETISDTDITYTNDAIYAYTYDSGTKKWTSTNHMDSATGTFIFTVKENGDYTINYVVSSEARYDKAKFYKNNTLIKEDSGTKEASVDLGTLSTTDEIKVEYTKDSSDASGNDNVIFEIGKVTNRVETENLQCQPNRTATKGINGQDGTTQSMNSATLFGRSYDYDLDTGVFTIENSTGLPISWTTNDNNSNGTADYKELIGTYTCLSSSATCNTLYYVGSINQDNTAQAYVAKYTIGDVAHFSQLGKSSFNPNRRSPALVGYMFNTEYDYKSESKSGEYFTNAVWENGAYVLSNGNSGTAPDVTHHYICDSDCTKVRYYYYVSGSSHYYILLENGKTVEDALKEMINYKTNANEIDENINVYNSAMKGYLDNWYKKNLAAYTSYLDSTTVYCNDRSIRDLKGWNPSGTSLTGNLQFKQYNVNRDLNCVNETDRFAVTNNKAELTYPIGLLTESERLLMTANFAKTGQYYWGASPNSFNSDAALVHGVNTTGDIDISTVSSIYGARGVVTLKPGTKLEDGTGTYDNPYIVGPLVTRTN